MKNEFVQFISKVITFDPLVQEFRFTPTNVKLKWLNIYKYFKAFKQKFFDIEEQVNLHAISASYMLENVLTKGTSSLLCLKYLIRL